jgi:ubiquinone/menaquinone biosynthesis C-methylase UbiE
MPGSKDYFDKVANDWDEMREEFFPDAVREAVFDLAEAQEGEIAADIGAGTGFLTEGLLERGLKVIAVDQSPEMLTVLMDKFSENYELECREGVAEDLPFDDMEVDHVFANMYLHHVEDPKAAIVEMSRILAPGGKLIITDLDSHEHQFLVDEQHDRWMGFDRDDVQEWFESAGLVDVVLDCVGSDCCAQSKCSEDEANISIFVVIGLKA